MDKDQKNVKEFMSAAGQAIRTTPAIPTFEERGLRVKLLIEEVLELAHASGVVLSIEGHGLISEEDIDIFDTGEENVDLVEVADALTDIAYVNDGAGLTYGIDLEPCKAEVQSSNMSKFIDGHRREDGKWVKGPSYRPAALSEIIENQKK